MTYRCGDEIKIHSHAFPALLLFLNAEIVNLEMEVRLGHDSASPCSVRTISVASLAIVLLSYHCLASLLLCDRGPVNALSQLFATTGLQHTDFTICL